MTRIRTLVALLPLFLLSTPATAIDECCNIVSVDAARGVVTAVETATGRTFSFSTRNSALLGALKPGMRFDTRGAPGSAVFSLTNIANVRPDSVEECCNLVSETRQRQPAQGAPVFEAAGKAPALGPQNAAQGEQQLGKTAQAPGVLGARALEEGVTLQITELRRINDKVLHLGFVIENKTNKPVKAESFGITGGTATVLIALLDLDNGKQYKAGNGVTTHSQDHGFPVKPNQRREFWGHYAAPPPEVTRLAVQIPGVAPVYNVPIAR